MQTWFGQNIQKSLNYDNTRTNAVLQVLHGIEQFRKYSISESDQERNAPGSIAEDMRTGAIQKLQLLLPHSNAQIRRKALLTAVLSLPWDVVQTFVAYTSDDDLLMALEKSDRKRKGKYEPKRSISNKAMFQLTHYLIDLDFPKKLFFT